MRLSLYSDYGLRVLMFLAGRAGRATIGEVSEFFGISKDHVAKVVQDLARFGYLRSVRGVGGGIELARPANEIRIGEVVRDMEGDLSLLECVSAKKTVCVIQPGCKLLRVLGQAEKVMVDYLNTVRLSDVVTPGQELITLTKPV